MDALLQALENPLVMFIALSFGVVAGTLYLGVVRSSSAATQIARFDFALQSIASSELDLDTNLIPVEAEGRSWGEYWLHLVTQSGRVPRDPQSPGRFASGSVLFGALGGYFLFGGSLIGLLGGPFVALGLLRLLLGFEQNKRIAAIDKQLPTLLAGLRANLSAQSTPQQALMDVANDMPSPLGDELRALKRDINVNVGLDAALGALGERVTSREMKFLVSSIQIAVRNGADLGPQIEVIQDIVQQRTRIRQKLRGAVSQVKPTQYLALGAVPFMFFFSLRVPSQRTFWFSDGLFWLAITAVIYGAGAIILRLMVKSVENT